MSPEREYVSASKRPWRALERLKDARDDSDYQAVGLLCRDAFIIFAEQVFSNEYTPRGENAPSRDAVNRRIELTMQHFGQLAGSESQRNLAKAAFAYAQRTHHNTESTRESAERTALLTIVSLLELEDLLRVAIDNERWQETYGVINCPECGSSDLYSDLYEDSWAELDSDGAISGGNFLACSRCRWKS